MVYAHHPPPGNMTQQRKRPKTLNALHNCWTTTLKRMEDLAHKHFYVTTHAYMSATTRAHAMKHLRDLRTMYNSAIRAKWDYHEVVDARLRVAISITPTHQRWQHYVAHTQKTYHTAKQDATAVGLHTRYRQPLHGLQIYEKQLARVYSTNIPPRPPLDPTPGHAGPRRKNKVRHVQHTNLAPQSTTVPA